MLNKLFLMRNFKKNEVVCATGNYYSDKVIVIIDGRFSVMLLDGNISLRSGSVGSSFCLGFRGCRRSCFLRSSFTYGSFGSSSLLRLGRSYGM